MFDNILGFGDQLFTVIVLVITAGISSHICFGFGTRKAKETFVGLILVLMVGTQFYHLITAVTHVPASKPYTFNGALHRTDCLESHKGGKRPAKGALEVDLNPCFCLPAAGNCTIKATGWSGANSSCPTDGTATCTSSFGLEIKRYHSSKRDCRGGQPAACTYDQPCTPCEIDKIIEFNSTRCRTCSTDFKGECNFIPEIGPYCLESPYSRKVVPCKTCCTEPEPVFVNGTCH